MAKNDFLAAWNRLTPYEQLVADWQLGWIHKRLDHQVPPPGDWTIWLLLAGRGAGKTRTAAETLGAWACMQPNTRWLVSAPTYGDLIGVCFEGESGLINCIPRELVAAYNKSDVELKLTNGSLIKGITAEKPERFRGPQFHGGWLDELAAWQYADEAFDLLMFGMRLGSSPKLICTTTPKPNTIIRNLLKREGKDVIVTRASTYANLANLAPTFRDQILRYEGTTIGRQEIHAEVINPEEMGVIRRSWIKQWPADRPLPELEFIVMSLDTAFTEETGSGADPDYSACTVWGVFSPKADRRDVILLPHQEGTQGRLCAPRTLGAQAVVRPRLHGRFRPQARRAPDRRQGLGHQPATGARPRRHHLGALQSRPCRQAGSVARRVAPVRRRACLGRRKQQGARPVRELGRAHDRAALHVLGLWLDPARRHDGCRRAGASLHRRS